MTMAVHSQTSCPPAVARIGLMGAQALLTEVCATPKPGLVDRANAGAHTDMNFHTFLHSAKAILPYFEEMSRAGFAHQGSPEALFPALREIGLRAEQAMFAATGGINTHKGAIFSAGLCCAAAWLYYREQGVFYAEGVLLLCGEMTGRQLRAELSAMLERAPRTHGEAVYHRYGLGGVRAEAAAGFPHVRGLALPLLRALRHSGLDGNDRMVQVLLTLVAELPDTNVLHRCGAEALAFAREQASAVLAVGGMTTAVGRAAVEALDEEFIRRRISPGGCADLLAVTVLADLLEDSTEGRRLDA